MLKIQEYMLSHPDWRVELTKEPYCLCMDFETMFGRNLVLFKYNQIASDFSLEIVKECRGIILDADTAEVVCYPFYKFFNYGEANQATIDWSSAFVSEKLDGSIIKVVRLGDDFLISTNGTIDAFQCGLGGGLGCPFHFFGELVMEGFKYYGISKADFPKYFEEGYTYIFELTSPWNQVVVMWDETKMNLIGIRDNKTLQEIKFMEHPLAQVFNTPKIYPITSIEECVKAAAALPDNNEGYVVCDANFNRVKVKSPKYIQLHYMASNQSWSPVRVMDIFRANEVSEYVVYFPKFKAAFDVMKEKYDAFRDQLIAYKAEADKLIGEGGISRKDFAKWTMQNHKSCSHFGFKYLDGKFDSVDAYLNSMTSTQLVEVLGLKESQRNG